MPTILFVRHGQSEANAGLSTLDPAGMPLTAEGRRQAERAREALSACARQDGAPRLVVTSPYARASETAAIASTGFGEVSREEWPVQEFTFLPAVAYVNTTLMDRRPLSEAYWTRGDPRFSQGDGAESFAGFASRVQAALDRLAAIEEGTVAVFTHRKFISGALLALLDGPIRASAGRMRRFRGFDRALAIPNGAIVRVRIEPGGPWVGPVLTAHLARGEG